KLPSSLQSPMVADPGAQVNCGEGGMSTWETIRVGVPSSRAERRPPASHGVPASRRGVEGPLSGNPRANRSLLRQPARRLEKGVPLRPYGGFQSARHLILRGVFGITDAILPPLGKTVAHQHDMLPN